MTIFFTSDPHLQHRRILEFESARLSWCNDLKSMNEIILNDWISLKETDTLFILGDLLFDKAKSYDMIGEKLSQVKCKMILIMGNHDDGLNQEWTERYFEVYDYYELSYNKRKIIMSHYPFEEWNGSRRIIPSIHIHGHCHSKMLNTYHPNRINVGIDSLDYQGRMISCDDLITLCDRRDMLWK